MKDIRKEKEEKEKKQEEENNFIKNNINTDFNDELQYLKYHDTLTKNNCSNDGRDYDVFIGLKDHIEYTLFKCR